MRKKSSILDSTNPHAINRRDALKYAAGLSGCALASSWLMPEAAQAQVAAGRRFIVIGLRGAWDSALATDPIIGAKRSSSTYDPYYNANIETFAVQGKANLKVGEGLKDALPAFASVPTAFVNGMYIEVTAHNLMANFMQSGILSLSVSRTHPSITAILGRESGEFPAHVLIDARVPLGDTKMTAPPIFVSSAASLKALLDGPETDLSALVVRSGNELRAAMDRINEHGQNLATVRALTPWNRVMQSLAPIYGRNLAPKLEPTPALTSHYGTSLCGQKMLDVRLTLGSGICRFVNLAISGFDTHNDHFDEHLPLVSDFAASLNALIVDLKRTPDPADPSVMLMDKTTILIESEFVRTQRLNATNGLDHWKSGSSIVMGYGVRDNTVLGATNASAQAMGWTAGQAVPLNDTNALLPSHLIAAILRSAGLAEQANIITRETKLDALFT